MCVRLETWAYSSCCCFSSMLLWVWSFLESLVCLQKRVLHNLPVLKAVIILTLWFWVVIFCGFTLERLCHITIISVMITDVTVVRELPWRPLWSVTWSYLATSSKRLLAFHVFCPRHVSRQSAMPTTPVKEWVVMLHLKTLGWPSSRSSKCRQVTTGMASWRYVSLGESSRMFVGSVSLMDKDDLFSPYSLTHYLFKIRLN